MIAAEPVFFNTDADQILAELKADYESSVGFVLSPGQAEMMIIQAFAYRFHLHMIQCNEAAKQDLLAFSRYPMIDYLGEIQGVIRLGAERATCTLQFSMETEHPALVIPKGVRVQSLDGKAVFITLEDVSAAEDQVTASVEAECTSEGGVGNGYATGEISIILDPQAYVSATSNITIPLGGADAESDDRLRERIRLAPSSFSSAGPRGAYIYFAKSAHNSIIDVGVTSLGPGTVNIYPLLVDAETPSTEILDAVYAICNADKVRPLTDTVVVSAPEKLEYEIEVNLTLLSGAIEAVEVQRATDNLNAYAAERKTKLGIDAVISQISAAASSPAVYKVAVISPIADVTADLSEVAFCTGVTVNLIGFSDE